jgi:tRNA (guanine9-N1)-methyltransferase
MVSNHSDLKIDSQADEDGEGASIVKDTTAIGVANEKRLSVSDAAVAINARDNPPKELSKKAIKKKCKWERKMEIKERRKKQEKDARYAKAKALGRDIEEERRIAAERTALGLSKQKRLENWHKENDPLVAASFGVCLDCSYESQMTHKEINSLSQQIRYCYSLNKRNTHPCLLTATTLDGETLRMLQNVMGYDEWTNFAFTPTNLPMEQQFQSSLSNLVYLTSDSETVLQEFDNTKVYVIGGIVDRNRLKRAAVARAELLGLQTAKLPLDEHLKEMPTTRVLTVNHVFEIILRYRLEKDWKKALMAVLPSRKEAKFVSATQEND